MKRLPSAVLAAGLLLSGVLGTSVGHAQTGKSIVIGMGQEPDRLYNSGMFVGTLVQNLIYDDLVKVDDKMQTFGSLAADIPTVENGLASFEGSGGDRRLVVRMPIRQGITFADGTPFTADNVVYLWNLMMNPESGFSTDTEEKYRSVDKLDDYTVQFTFLSANEARAKDPVLYANQGTDPVVDPLYFFGLPNLGFQYPAHKIAEIAGPNPLTSTNLTAIDSSDLARNPVSTGPYVLQSWEPGVQLTFVSRGMNLPQRLGMPRLDTVVFRIIPAKDTNVAALEAGEVQVITTDVLDVGDSAVLDNLPNIQARYILGTVWEHLTFNLESPVLSDKRVRKAIAYGINRQELNDVILFGKGEVSNSQVPSWSWAHNPDVVKYPYNPGLADQLLLQAGWTRSPSDGIRVKDGQRLSLNYWSTGSAFRPRLLPLVKDQLAQIGVEMRIQHLTAAVFFDGKASSPQSIYARKFDVAEFAWVGGYDPGATLQSVNHSRNIPTVQNNYRGGNIAGFRHDQNDRLLDQGLASIDVGFRQIAYALDQEILMEELPVLPLLLRPVTGAAVASLQNYRPTISSTGETWNIEQWDY